MLGDAIYPTRQIIAYSSNQFLALAKAQSRQARLNSFHKNVVETAVHLCLPRKRRHRNHARSQDAVESNKRIQALRLAPESAMALLENTFALRSMQGTPGT